MSGSNNLSAVLLKTNDLQLLNRPIPEPADDEVLLKMSCVGICGSDVDYVIHGRIAHFIVTKPMVIGHESSGIVAKCGKNVTNLKVGDRVAIEPGVACCRCCYCKNGQYNLCPEMKFCATPPYDGNLCRYYTHSADFCFKLPDHVSMEEGALLEPLSVGVHACRRGHVGVGDTVLILGAGPIGLVNMLAAKAMGASKVLITDVVENRLQTAKELGADYVLNTKDANTNYTAKIESILGTLPNKTIDCVGAEATVRLGIETTASGGILVVVGLRASEVKIPMSYALSREVSIVGVFRYCNDYPLALDLVASGKINVKPLITHHYTLEESLEAVETARTGRDNAIKVMIHCDPSYRKKA